MPEIQPRETLSVNKTENGKQRPERKLTLFFIATAGLFTFYATILGALALANMSGFPTSVGEAFVSHPYLQIFGFLTLFVVGVGYSLLPLFKSRRVSNIWIGYLVYSLITLANLLLLAASFDVPAYYLLAKISSGFILAASALFAYQALDLLRPPRRLLVETEPFMIISSVSFLVLSIAFFLSTFANYEVFTIQFLYLVLVGFIGSMIYGVVLRTVAFRLTTYRKKTAVASYSMQVAAIVVSALALLLRSSLLSALASLLFFAAAIGVFGSAKIMDRTKPLLPLGSNAVMPNRIQSYTDRTLISAWFWLLLGCAIGAALIITGDESFLIRDLFIHVIAIGFIGSTIIGYAPVLLPGVLASRGPKENLSIWPLIFLDAGLVTRVAGNSYALVATTSLPIWESVSGPLIILSMILFSFTLHSGRPKIARKT